MTAEHEPHVGPRDASPGSRPCPQWEELGPWAGPSPLWTSVPTAVNRGVAGRGRAELPTVFLAPELASVQACSGLQLSGGLAPRDARVLACLPHLVAITP